MNTPFNQVFYPENFNDLFSVWQRYPDAVLYAGGSDIIRSQGRNVLLLPKLILCLDKINDLRRITRSEQFLEIGSMVKLNQILRLGKKVPVIMIKCLEKISGVQVRNIATIGGNICASSALYDLPGVLTALDAQYEIKGVNTSRWVPASRFHSEPSGIKKQEILSRIRLPLVQWDYSIYKKYLKEGSYDTESLVFLARAQKTILADLRIIYKHNRILRNRASEDAILGKNLPINRKFAQEFVINWKEFLENQDNISDFSKNALLNNIEENIYILAD